MPHQGYPPRLQTALLEIRLLRHFGGDGVHFKGGEGAGLDKLEPGKKRACFHPPQRVPIVARFAVGHVGAVAGHGRVEQRRPAIGHPL